MPRLRPREGALDGMVFLVVNDDVCDGWRLVVGEDLLMVMVGIGMGGRRDGLVLLLGWGPWMSPLFLDAAFVLMSDCWWWWY